jgi:uncharacterized protein
MYATVGHHEAVVSLLLSYGVSDSRNRFGMTALHIAAKEGQSGIVQRLLNVSKTGNGLYQQGPRMAPLAFAAANGHESLVKLLLAEIPDVILGINLPNVISLSITESIILLLIEKGVDISAKDAARQTALLKAIDFRLVDISKLLLQNGTNPQAKDHFANTALHGAAKNGNPDLILLSCDQVEMDSLNATGESALHEAAMNGHEDVLQIVRSWRGYRKVRQSWPDRIAPCGKGRK